VAEIIRCDGDCGKESPNPKTGLHDANRWTTINVAPGGERGSTTYILCPECVKRDLFVRPLKGRHHHDKPTDTFFSGRR